MISNRLEARQPKSGAVLTSFKPILEAEIVEELKHPPVGRVKRRVVLDEAVYNSLKANHLGTMCGLALAASIAVSLVVLSFGISIGIVQSTGNYQDGSNSIRQAENRL